MTRITEKAVLNKDNATNNAKIKINALEWYVPHYTPSLEEYNKLGNQITGKTPTELHYPEKSVFHERIILKNFGLLNYAPKKVLTSPYGIM